MGEEAHRLIELRRDACSFADPSVYSFFFSFFTLAIGSRRFLRLRLSPSIYAVLVEIARYKDLL